MITLTLIRHPQTESNEKHQIAGSNDVLVSEKGIKTANLFAEHYKGAFDNYAFYSSAKKRCELLFDVLAQHNTKLEGKIDDRLNERDFGLLTSLSKDMMMQIFRTQTDDHSAGDNFTAWMNKKIVYENGNQVFEPNSELNERIMPCYEEIEEKFLKKGRSAIIQTHSGVIRQSLSGLLQLDPCEIDTKILPNNKIPNLSQTQVIYDENTGLFRINPDMIAYIDPKLQKKFNEIE